MTMMRRSLIALCCCLVALASSAQQDLLIEANGAYREGDLAGARGLLDKAVKEVTLVNSPETWVLRGFVYKDLYKNEPAGPSADLLRDEALASLFMGRETDGEKVYAKNIAQAYDFLTKTIYNDAAKALNDLDHERGIALYAKYKEACLRFDQGSSFTARDIEFDNALGTVYTKIYTQDRNDTVWYHKAAQVYRKVLARDPENYGANYNLATLYYNRGVSNIKAIDAENDIPSLRQIQEVSREFFLQALPYMTKAHQLNPKRKETILGLESIHYSLQDVEESERYRQLYEEIEQDPLAPQEDK